jgi:hypothetical protein
MHADYMTGVIGTENFAHYVEKPRIWPKYIDFGEISDVRKM